MVRPCVRKIDNHLLKLVVYRPAHMDKPLTKFTLISKRNISSLRKVTNFTKGLNNLPLQNLLLGHFVGGSL